MVLVFVVVFMEASYGAHNNRESSAEKVQYTASIHLKIGCIFRLCFRREYVVAPARARRRCKGRPVADGRTTPTGFHEAARLYWMERPFNLPACFARFIRETTMSISTILLILLVLLLVGALPTWPYSGSWGYFPSGGLGLVLIVLLVLVVSGRL
jgi:hypothetical protein